MLLRSSSTPIFGNLIPFPHDPLFPFPSRSSKDFETIHKNLSKKPPLPHKKDPHIHYRTRISFSNNLNLLSFSSNNTRQNSFRRVGSDGNLVSAPTDNDENRPMLHKAPSLSVFNNQIPDGFEEVKDVNVKKDQISSGKEVLERTVTIGEAINEAVNCDGGDKDFSFGEEGMGLIEEEEGEEELEEVVNGGIQNLGFGGEVERKIGSPPLCLDSGIGIGGVGLDLDLANLNEGRDIMEMEEYYKRMVERCPFHPLFLRNYAQFLQSKGDLHGAEEYYSRASLADPEDGEIWMQYAKLVWDLHRDQERASSYFKLATEVSPQDCVLAAYASFLWEIEDDEEEVSQTESINELGLRVAGGVRIGEPDSFTDVSRRSENLEDHYRKMIKENPNNPLFLRNYAKFLSESKADLQGAEEYYLRAVLADPGDGEITAEYAKLVWELHHDSHKASICFERAVQASPENCHVLAAYASFLWQNDDDEEDGLRQENRVQVPRNHERTMTAANV